MRATARPGAATLRAARRGAALAMALFALVTMAAIADAVLAPALASRRAAWRLAAYHAAGAEAERAIGSIAGTWTPVMWRALPVGHESVTVRQVAVRGVGAAGITVESRMRRLSTGVFRVAAQAQAPLGDAPAASHRSLLLELVRDSLQRAAALTAGGDIRLDEETKLVVTNACAPPDETAASTLLAAPSSVVTRDGLGTVEGSRDTLASAPATYAAPAGIPVSALMAAAAIRLPHGTAIAPGPRESGGQCSDAPDNWGGGDSSACAAHKPVVVAEGDLLVRGGMGQGALVVNGRLTIEGPFQYQGLIVAAGGVETTGGPVTLDGALFTSSSASATLHGSTTVSASACALTGAADAAARIAVVPVRGWWR